MPNMIYKRSGHSLVAVKSKLFAIGVLLSTCEVYDSRSGKFVAMKPLPKCFSFNFKTAGGAVSMGSRVVVFQGESPLIAFYDVDKDQWSEERYDSGENYLDYYFENCNKIHQI